VGHDSGFRPGGALSLQRSDVSALHTGERHKRAAPARGAWFPVRGGMGDGGDRGHGHAWACEGSQPAGREVSVPASGEVVLTGDGLGLHVMTGSQVGGVQLRAGGSSWVDLQIPYRLVRRWGREAHGVWLEVVGRGRSGCRRPPTRSSPAGLATFRREGRGNPRPRWTYHGPAPSGVGVSRTLGSRSHFPKAGIISLGTRLRTSRGRLPLICCAAELAWTRAGGRFRCW
jgi:hypothetical protein